MAVRNVFFIPFAGGSKYSYRDFVKRSDGDLNVIAIDLPGRGGRLDQQLIGDIDTLAHDVFLQIHEKTTEPYAIFGHSMGAIITYLVARKLMLAGLPLPQHIFFSGCPGPSVYTRSGVHMLPRSEFLNKLKELDGSPAEMFLNDDLLNFFEPILRSDFKALYSFEYKGGIKIPVPITILTGESEDIDSAAAGAWQVETSRDMRAYRFPGRHFFIFDHVDDIVSLIRSSF